MLTTSLALNFVERQTDSTAISSFFYVGRNSADCTVNLINNGVNVQEGMVSVHFTGTGAASFYTCQVDRQPRHQCFSKFLVCVNHL